MSIRNRYAWRVLGAGMALALAASAFQLTQPQRADAADYPGAAEIQAAKEAVRSATADVALLDQAVAALEEAAHQADAAARLAADEYAYAQSVADAAELELAAAEDRAAQAEAALEEARIDLAEIAMAVYQSGSGLNEFEALLSADGFEDVIVRSEAQAQASVQADDTVQRVKATEIVAQTTRDKAAEAAEAARTAAEEAATALAAAQSAQAQANAALVEAEATRQEALERLAELRNTSVELERQRQAGLAADRAREAQERWEREQAQQPPASSNPGGGNTNPAPSNPAPTNPAPTNPAPTTPAPNDPAPAPTTPAPTTPSTPSTGTWKSTAEQGQRAVDHALTLMGSPYQLGGYGPAYDCSGLTKASWAAAGYTLPHSSKQQYQKVTKISYSELRPGDLIFWGTNKDPNKIYHVAIYIGGGKVAEASTYGVPARTRVYNNWAVNDMMPYAGRV